MKNNIKIILSAVIVAAVVSMLFMVIPVTDAFVISYIFTLLGICGVAGSLCVFGKGSNKAPQGFAYISSAITYVVVSLIFSVIACVVVLSLKWTLVIHVGILAVFVIRIIALSSGNEYISKLDEISNEKSKEFQKEKQNYWK